MEDSGTGGIRPLVRGYRVQTLTTFRPQGLVIDSDRDRNRRHVEEVIRGRQKAIMEEAFQRRAVERAQAVVAQAPQNRHLSESGHFVN